MEIHIVVLVSIVVYDIVLTKEDVVEDIRDLDEGFNNA